MTSPDNNTAITVENLSKTFRIYKERDRSLKRRLLRQRQGAFEEFHALNDVTLSIPRGSTFGLLGQNGSGKSTLLKCIAKILAPDSGHITSTGRMAAMLEVGSGFHPDLSGRENIYLNGAILGMSRKEIEKKFDEIVAFSGVEKFIDQPVKNYSSGMYVRLGFAVSIHVEPEILLVDEILAVGDLEFQEKCLNKFAQFRQEGRTVVVVSHALEMMRTFCDEAAWLNHGKLVASGSAASIVDRYSNMAHGAVRVEEGGTRFGSGEAKITKMEWIGPQGTDTRKVHTGDPITIRLHYECLQAIKRPVFGASIDTREGFWVWGHHSLDDSFVPEMLLPGTGSVDITIPHLPLRPATYYLSASIQNFEVNQVIDAWQKGVAFDVLPWVGMESGGVVAFGSHFKNLCPPAEMAKLPVRDEAYWQELAAHTEFNAADNA
ncbi:ABC transporter, ATP-binding protein [Mobiluncus mulieris 28-1]|uniref:Teichoic acids export ATP-binding protein TagH n=1 Tax=Mobiluncus mulieris TaxID=2052 RepID=A0A2J9KRQ7_9ACTO|nr:ABC transporter ATP-binding protein [Mobiluncus mulieris]EEJ54265.1 ABC transporter, ATP-binding protein [Mobiluncus mulieris ATCC 35243]EEZ90176.1 ABC transporter, ATP-binding protein [Mobiluncus mulieris 28-1]EFN93048.1 ABC transporter, ATP-binding protein [Mobiluncus mulieris FB024-16]MBB5846318.1 ABC-2 type transport system ATP-binding protein [Mobiluncus mulieris]MCU9996662.1 ABC transporter ATP-binding protein [Mobiluncus mulieris]